MKLWPMLGVAFLLIAAWGASMRLSWSLGRENARNEAQASTLKSTAVTLNIISAGVRGTGYAAGAGATPHGKSATQSGRRGKT